MERKVVYFHGGQVVEFDVPDDLYVAVAERVTELGRAYERDELEKARGVLEALMGQVADSGDAVVTGNELAAAGYVWHFFNANPDEEQRIDGDIIIVDVEGDGQEVNYSALADVELREE